MSTHRRRYSKLRRTCYSEIELSNIFERHSRILLEQKRKMINEINEWADNLIRQIEQNLVKQKNLVEHEYQLQSSYLHRKQQAYLDSTLEYEEQKHRHEVRQLLERCRTLKFQLASFDYPEQMIPFIQMQPKQQSNRNLSILNHRDMHHTKTRASNCMTTDDIRDEKCPVCFMIFSLSMTTTDRAQHVNQHFGDS